MTLRRFSMTFRAVRHDGKGGSHPLSVSPNSCSVSTRETLMAGKLVSDGWTALEAMELTFLPLFEGTRTDGERSIVSKIFMTR